VRREYLVRFMKSLLRNCFWISCLLLFSCKSGEQAVPTRQNLQRRDPVPMRIYWVTASGGLRIRSQPSAESAVVGSWIRVRDRGRGLRKTRSHGQRSKGLLAQIWRRLDLRWISGRGMAHIPECTRTRYPHLLFCRDRLSAACSSPGHTHSFFVYQPPVFSSAPGWIHGSFSIACAITQARKAGFPGRSTAPPCRASHSVPTALSAIALIPRSSHSFWGEASTIGENCVYQSSIGLMPEGGCPVMQRQDRRMDTAGGRFDRSGFPHPDVSCNNGAR
jgi:hypothetical protein